MWHAWGKGEVFTGFWLGAPKVRIPRRKWEDNITMDLGEIGIDGTNWIQLGRNTVKWRVFVNTAMNLTVP
jgi:hypothetical protein